jgi:hypothetical protein
MELRCGHSFAFDILFTRRSELLVPMHVASVADGCHGGMDLGHRLVPAVLVFFSRRLEIRFARDCGH